MIKNIEKSRVYGGLAALALASGLESQGVIVAEWNFNEGSGLTAHDSTGNGNNGTLQGGVNWTTDSVRGYALRFDGVDDRISAIKSSSLDLTLEVALDVWIKRDNNQDGTIFSRNGPFYIAVRDNKLEGGIHTSGGPEGWTIVQGNTFLQPNEWYHLSLSYDGSNIKGYVNNSLEDVSPKSGIMVVRSQPPYIGWGEPGQNFYFSGIIDEVKVYGNASAIPEPSSYGIALGLGVLGAGMLKRRNGDKDT